MVKLMNQNDKQILENYISSINKAKNIIKGEFNDLQNNCVVCKYSMKK